MHFFLNNPLLSSSQEVISNCVGDSDHKLTLDGDLSFLDKVHPQIHFMDDDEKKKKENTNKSYNTNANAQRGARRGLNNNNEDDDEGGEGFEDELDPLDAVAAANAGNQSNNAGAAAATAADTADGRTSAAPARNQAGSAAANADASTNVLTTATTMTTTTMNTKKRIALPAFIYEDAAYHAAEDEDEDGVASGAASPRFRTEAAVRAAVNDAASIASLDLENENYNANAEEAGEGRGGGGAGRRVLIPKARRNYNENCGICKRPPRTEKAKDEEGVRKWKQPKTCKMLLGELYKGGRARIEGEGEKGGFIRDI